MTRIRTSHPWLLATFAFAMLGGCTFDVSGLKDGQTGNCGNGQLDTGELCDGLQFLTSCEDLGYWGGNLACQLDCTLDDSGCIDACGECLPPASRCVDDAVHTCVMRNDGCGYYVPEVDCGVIRQWCTEIASAASCTATCLDQCEPGQRACSPDGTSLEGCVEVMSGEAELCSVWHTLRLCGVDGCEDEPEPLCTDPCEDACEADTEMCSPDGRHRLRCLPGYAGCLDWIEQMPSCLDGTEICEMSQGLAVCTCAVCAVGEKRCSADGTEVLACVDSGEGCSHWNLQSDCNLVSPFLRCSAEDGFVCEIYGKTCASALIVDPAPDVSADTDIFDTFFDDTETFTDLSCGPTLVGASDAFIQVHMAPGGTIRAAQVSGTGPTVRFRIQAANACGSTQICLAQADQELVYTSFSDQDIIISAEIDITGVHTTEDVNVVIERLPNDCTDAETEVNNTPADSDLLASQAQERWGFCSRLKTTDLFSADVDCFAFTVPIPGRRFELGLTALLDADTCIGDAQIRLYKPDGTLLATSPTVSDAPCTRIAAELAGMEPLIALPPSTYRACVARAPLMPEVDVVTRLAFFAAPATPLATSFFNCPAIGWSVRSQSSVMPGSTWQCDTSGSRFMRVTVADPEFGRFYLVSPSVDLTTAGHAILQFDHLLSSTALSVAARVVASTDDFTTSFIELANYSTNTTGRQTVFVPAHQLAGLAQPVKLAFILDLPSSLEGGTTTWEVDEVTLYAW